PAAADAEPLVKSSAVRAVPVSSSKCVCGSTTPGSTRRSFASITGSCAGIPARTSAIFPSRTSTSASSSQRAVTTRPPRISMAASRSCRQYLRADLVDVARIKVQTVDDLPQRRHGLQRIAPLKRGEILAFPQDSDEVLVALDEGALGIAQLHAHRVLHAVTLLSPAVPITVRSSCRRFALSSNRGRLPFSTFLTPKRRPSWACDSDFAS